MSIRAEHMPTEHTLLTVVDGAARGSVREAQAALAPVVTANTPRRTGATAEALRPRVSRTSTGHSLTVAPPRGRRHPRSSTGATIAQVMRWVQRGTGLHRVGAGAKAPIRGKRYGFFRGPLNVYGKQYQSVEGQDPNPFMERIRVAGGTRVEPLLERGAQVAARELERAVD